jgi:hypothetical protein
MKGWHNNAKSLTNHWRIEEEVTLQNIATIKIQSHLILRRN